MTRRDAYDDPNDNSPFENLTNKRKPSLTRRDGYDDPKKLSQLYGVEEPMFPGGAGRAPGQLSIDCSKAEDAIRRLPVFPNGVNVTVQDVLGGGPKLAICTSTSAGLDQVGKLERVPLPASDAALIRSSSSVPGACGTDWIK